MSWLHLTDPAECTHLIDLLADVFDDDGMVYSNGIDEGIAARIIAPAHEFVTEFAAKRSNDVDAARDLIAAAREVMLLTRAGRVDPQLAQRAVQALERAWLMFIACAAGPKMYVDMPAMQQRARKAASAERTQTVEHDLVRADYQRLLKDHSDKAARVLLRKMYVGTGAGKISRTWLDKILAAKKPQLKK